MSSNISSNYTLTSYETNKSERKKSVTVASVAATASVEIFTHMASVINDQIITLVDADSLSKTYYFDTDNEHGSTGTVSGSYTIVQLAGLTTSIQYAGQLETAIKGSTGHAGGIIVNKDPAVQNTLYLTQSTAGAVGNTAIVTGSSNLVFLFNAGGAQSFLHGVTGETTSGTLDVSPFGVSTNTPNNLRGQTTSFRYKVFLGEEKS